MSLEGVMLNKADILNSVHANGGVIQYIADCLECSRTTIYEWMERDAEVKEAVSLARQQRKQLLEDMDEEAVDEAYRSLKRLLKSDNAGVVMFTLERKGKWVKPESTTSNQPTSLTFQVNMPKEIANDARNSSDTVAISSTPLPSKDIKGSKKRR
jgi:hypothetical protein